VALLYILAVLCFIKKFKGNLKHNFHFHGYNTRGKTYLHTQSCNKASFQKNVNMGIKLYNRLPERIKIMNDFKSFKKRSTTFTLNPLALELDIYSLAHHLCKMRIFCEGINEDGERKSKKIIKYIC